MKHSRLSSLSLLFAPAFCAASLLFCLSAGADVPKSLLPAFGNQGADFTVKAKDGHIVQGWLPENWNDNTDWAAVNATYTKLTDSPDPAAGAVRIAIQSVDDGQLQLTTYGGNQKYKKGSHYVITGWVRSADKLAITVGPREMVEPYEYFHEEELTTGPEWKHFEVSFTPGMDYDALIMFVVKEAGAVDVAGVALEEKP